MAIKFTEKEIQEAIWCKRETIFENIIFPENMSEENIPHVDILENFSTEDLMFRVLFKKHLEIQNKLIHIKLFACEVPLEKESDSTIRADFLGTTPGVEGLTIVELKKSRKTERESFTELLGYAGHLQSKLPGIGRNDILSVLICPFYNRTLREAYLYSFLIDKRSVAILIPEFTDPNDVNSVVLKYWFPEKKSMISFTNSIFNPKNFSVIKIAWEYEEGHWNSQEREREFQLMRFDLMNKVSALAVQKMEEKGIVGFCFSSQAWEELCEKIFLEPNFLVLVALNPIKCSLQELIQQSVHAEENKDSNDCEINSEEENNDDASDFCADDLLSGKEDLSLILDGIEKAKYFSSEDCQLYDLSIDWTNHLWELGFKIVDLVTKNVKGKKFSKDWGGGHNWETYQRVMLEDVCVYNLDVRPSSLLKEIYVEYLEIIYEANENKRNQFFITGEIPNYTLIEAYNNNFYFREFLRVIGL